MAALFETPREATASEIHDIVERFGRSAAIVRKAGFSGVQIHGAHGLRARLTTDTTVGTLVPVARLYKTLKPRGAPTPDDTPTWLRQDKRKKT